VTIAEPEPAQPVVVAAELVKDLLVLFRVRRAQAVHAGGDRPAARHAILGIARPASRGRVQAIDAVHQRGVAGRIRFDQQPSHVLRNPVGQPSHGRAVVSRREQIRAGERPAVDGRDARPERRLRSK
jgi:hypothetical protein